MANKNQNTKQNDNFNSSFTIFLALIALATMLRLAKMHGIVKSDDASVPKTAQPARKIWPAPTVCSTTSPNLRSWTVCARCSVNSPGGQYEQGKNAGFMARVGGTIDWPVGGRSGFDCDCDKMFRRTPRPGRPNAVCADDEIGRCDMHRANGSIFIRRASALIKKIPRLRDFLTACFQ